MLLLAYVITMTSLLASSARGDDPVVNTTHGLLRGQRMRVLERDLDVFLSVPFATPPVGSLRFRKPRPLEPWEGIRNATETAPSCPQLVYPVDIFPLLKISNASVRQEDCLYLNVWAPKLNTSQSPKAVMVWIYGGSFNSGTISNQNYNGRFLAAHGDVIVVTVNYRLGALGFLFLGTPEVPGNMGLWDQRLAVEWVRNNAASFGGDPGRITLFGESAGAVSVNHLAISPKSRDLVSGAIMQSGSSLAFWGTIDSRVLEQRSLALARVAGCPTAPKEAVTRCLLQVDPMTLVTSESVAVPDSSIVFGPVVDGDFLPVRPEELVKEGSRRNTSLLFGDNKDEFGLFMILFPDLARLTPDLEINRSSFMELTRRFLAPGLPYPDLDYSRLLPAVLTQYKGGSLPSEQESYLSLVIKICGDAFFNCPETRTAALHSTSGGSGARAWYYLFEHFLSTNAPLPRWMGVKHADELALVFGMPLDPSLVYTQQEQELSRRFMSYWTQFAKTGDPNVDGLPVWPQYEADYQRYLSLDVNMTEKAGYRHRQCAFWKDAFPLLMQATRPRSTQPGEPAQPCTNGEGRVEVKAAAVLLLTFPLLLLLLLDPSPLL